MTGGTKYFSVKANGLGEYMNDADLIHVRDSEGREIDKARAGELVHLVFDAGTWATGAEWTDSEGNFVAYGEDTTFIMPPKDMEINLNYRESSYSYWIDFDMNGHGKPIDSQMYESNDTYYYSLPEPASDDSFSFVGWYFDRYCKKAVPENARIRSSITL